MRVIVYRVGTRGNAKTGSASGAEVLSRGRSAFGKGHGPRVGSGIWYHRAIPKPKKL